MAMRFDDWEGEYLEHHGIRGMKWGVRRYQNEDGSLTTAGKQRYGMSDGEGQRKTSARKMQRDINNLDRGFANVAAEKRAANNQFNKRLRKTIDYSNRQGYGPDFRSHRDSDKKLNKLMNKTDKSLDKTIKSIKQMKEIQALQFKIIAKAADKGYTVTSKPVVRLGNTGKQRVASIFAATAVGGGAIAGAIVGGVRGATALKVGGQQFKIRKKGNGTQQVVNYHEQNEAERKRRRG